VEPGNIRIRKNLVTDVGISPNGAAKMMSGVPWAMLALLPLIGKRKHGLLLIGLCIGGVYALALTGGRSGFAACGATFVLLCLVRWRRYLVVLPVLVVVATIAFPGAAARMTTGFDQTTVSGEEFTNFDDVTSGRVFIWPVAISKVCESPLFGFGRNAMTRTGARQFLADEYGEESGRVVSHPHNAYLEVLLDSGLIGLVVVVGFHLCIWVYSIRLFRDRYDALYASVGGFTLSLLTGHLVSFMGGQSFYPEEIDVGLWCAMGVVLRVYVDRTRRLAKAYWSNGDPSIENRQWQTACGPSWGAIVDHG